MNKLLIFIIIVIICIFSYYKFIKKEYTKLFYDKILLDNKYTSSVSNLYLPESQIGNKFTYTFWIYFQNINENSKQLKSNYDYYKFIFSRNDSPGIYYKIKTNILKFVIKYKDKDNYLTDYSLFLRKLKLQKWMHIALVLNNRDIKIYLNGQLYKSNIIPSVPFIFDRELIIGEKNNNFNGNLFDGRYYNNELNQKKIMKIFNEGKNIMQ